MTLFTGSILLSSTLLTGCGGTVVDDTYIDKKPQFTLKADRTTTNYAEVTDWTWYVHIEATQSASVFSIDAAFAKGIPAEVQHLQYFLDVDNNPKTGFSYGEGSYEISGADYLIEDGDLYKSNSQSIWDWTYVGKFAEYKKTLQGDGSASIHIESQDADILSIIQAKQINVSIEPFNANWVGTYSTISTQAVIIDIEDNAPVVQPPVIEEPVIAPNETMYEDAEDGLSNNWTVIKGNDMPIRKTPGYKNQSKAFVKLPNHWTQDANGQWSNSAEYHLAMNDTEHTILSVDIVGDGTPVEHYVLGAKVTTSKGERFLLWDSFYNHENIPATRRVYDNGAIFIVFPSPVEMVRGYEYSDVYLSENFTVDLEKALKQFEPDNHILSVDTFIATGGNLDNIKLLTK